MSDIAQHRGLVDILTAGHTFISITSESHVDAGEVRTYYRVHVHCPGAVSHIVEFTNPDTAHAYYEDCLTYSAEARNA